MASASCFEATTAPTASSCGKKCWRLHCHYCQLPNGGKTPTVLEMSQATKCRKPQNVASHKCRKPQMSQATNVASHKCRKPQNVASHKCRKPQNVASHKPVLTEDSPLRLLALWPHTLNYNLIDLTHWYLQEGQSRKHLFARKVADNALCCAMHWYINCSGAGLWRFLFCLYLPNNSENVDLFSFP